MLQHSNIGPNGDHNLYTITIGGDDTTYESAVALEELFDRLYLRSSRDSTIWLKVLTPTVPTYVIAALEEKAALPIPVVLTCSGDCTLGPIGKLSVKVQRAVAGMGHDSRIWHPIQEKFVSSLRDADA